MQVFADAALARTRILPVLQLEDAALAAPLARALNLPVYVHEADTALPERLTGGPQL